MTSASGGSTKKNKNRKQKKPTAADVFAVPGTAHKPKRDVLDYSRFDAIGKKEQARADREERLKQVPAGLRSRLGPAEEDMVLEMAEKMRDNPELRPTPEMISKELGKEPIKKAAARRAAAAKISPKGTAAGSGHVSTHIANTRDDFVRQMQEMEEQKQKLEEQQKKLERMSSGEGGPEELAEFLIEQGLSEDAVLEMMSNPNAEGVEQLQAAMERGLGIHETVELDTEKMAQVDEVTDKLKGLASGELNDDGIEEFSTEGFSANRRGGGKEQQVRGQPSRRMKQRPMNAEARKIKAQMEVAERQMAAARAAAEAAQAEHAAATQAIATQRRELAEAEAAKAEAGTKMDAELEHYKQSGTPAGVHTAGEIAAAREKVDAEAAAAAATDPDAGPIPSFTVQQRGSMVVGWTLRVTVDLPLVASFASVDLTCTAHELKVCCTRPGQHGPLTVTLPCAVDPDTAAAKYVKKKRSLRVDLEVLQGELPTTDHGF